MALVVIVKLCITKMTILGSELPINHSLIMKNCISMRTAQSKRVLTTPASFGKQKYVGILSRLLPMASLLDYPLMYYVTLYYINIKKKKISVEPRLLL